jgi:alcohol dehydrogenase
MGSSQSAPHPQGKTITGIGFVKHGPALESLQKVKFPYPHGFDASSNVVIKVHASSINPVDKMLIEGGLKMLKPVAAFPHPACYDVSGVVEIADSAGKFKVGDAVMVRLFDDEKNTPWYRGAMAEYCVARCSDTVRKPDNISFEEAASIPLAGMTALQAFQKAGLKQGDKVFITGGAGGVGTLAIQLAKHVFKAGLVVTTASAGAKEQLCKDLGADVVVDYRTAKFEEVYGTADAEKFDVCFDTTHESVKLAKVVKKGGTIYSIADSPTLEGLQAIGASNPLLCLFVTKTVKHPSYLAAVEAGADWTYLFLGPSQADLQLLADKLKDGTVKPVLDNVWDFKNDEATGWRAAFEQQFSGRSKGKCIVRFC